MAQMSCQPQELQAIKDALDRNPNNLGVGILHEPTGQIHLAPMDALPNRGGHDELAQLLNLPQGACKGFSIAKQGAAYTPFNVSHLNGPQGQPGSLQMPSPTFAAIVQALQDAGL